MNRNLQISERDASLYPIEQTQLTEVTEIEVVEVKEIEISEVPNLKIVTRFERLKKNLRKRSHSIL